MTDRKERETPPECRLLFLLCEAWREALSCQPTKAKSKGGGE